MQVTIYGSRGSIPTPGPDTIKYGGNTTCLEVIGASGDRVIIDGGSGIRPLGLKLLSELPLTTDIFITHTHWDHIQGLPFFVPFFIPGNTINIHGTFDPVYKKDLRDILSGQMEYCYFPVRSNELKAEINYSNLQEQKPVQVGSLTITPILMNHPVLTFGYRIDEGDKRFFFTGDHEPPQNIYNPEDDEFQMYQDMIELKTKALCDFVEGSDLLLVDAQYTDAEYPEKVGWGHSTYEMAVDFAKRSNAKHVCLTHHDPTRTDNDLDEILSSLPERVSLPESLKISMAQEGQVIEL